MTDQCIHCTLRGDIKTCKATECFHHENWYAVQQQKRIEELEKHLLKCASLLTGWKERGNLITTGIRIDNFIYDMEWIAKEGS